MEKDSYALFVDNSGSVGGSVNYWDTVDTILIKYAKDISHYYLWNSTIKQSNKKELEEWIKGRKATGGTQPQTVADTVVK